MAKRNSKSNRPKLPYAGPQRPSSGRSPGRPLPTRPAQPPDRRDAAPEETARAPRPAARPGSRADRGRPWLWGRHAVLAALANDRRKIRRLLIARSEEPSLPADLPIRPEIVEREVIARTLPDSAVHQGYALLADPLPEAGLSDILIGAEGRQQAIVLALDQVTDPQNVGAIVRSAAALGAVGVVMTEAHAPPSDGALAKAASGALERIPLARVPNLVGAFDKLKAEGFWIAGLEAEAPKTLAEAALSGRIVLVLGAEGTGLRRLTRERCDWLLRIPLSGAVESLNVSAAAACALYELARLGLSGTPPDHR
ncbi:MAG: 23S rRNA (guanosine(2251)-2'-O)-methyltransferase RlmB [Hyphomicrobium sp.]